MTIEAGAIDPDEEVQQLMGELVPKLRIELDWEAYWERFKQEHGLYPLRTGGRYTFPDGWQYSLQTEQGQEYSPPKKDFKKRGLQLIYWRQRLSIQHDEAQNIEALRQSLLNLQEVHSAPLQYQTVRYRDDGSEESVFEDLGLSGLEARLEWLKNDLRVCETVIHKLEDSRGGLTIEEIEDLTTLCLNSVGVVR